MRVALTLSWIELKLFLREPLTVVFTRFFSVIFCTKSILELYCFTSTPNSFSICCSSLPASTGLPSSATRGLAVKVMVVATGPPSGVV